MPAFRGARGKGANHGAQRFGIGVVAVVENGGAGDLDDFAALVSGRERLESGDGGVEIDSGFEGDGEPGHGIRCVVFAEQMQGEAAFAFAGAIVHVQAGEVFRRLDDLRIGAGAVAEVDDAAGKVAAELRDVGIGAIEEGDAGGGQCGDKLKLCARDAGLAFGEVFNVRGADVGDDAPVGRGDAGKRGDFAAVVHAHFNDGEFVLGLEAQQLQRQAECVVEISLRLEHVELCGERGGDGFLGGGFAGRAGDGDDALAPLAANMGGEGLQGEQRIFGDEKRHGESCVGQRGDAGARDDRGHGSALDGSGDVIVAIEALAADGEEELAGRDGARVDGVAGDGEGAACAMLEGASSTAPCANGRFCEGQFHCTPPYPRFCASAARATSVSSKGIVRPARICSFSWPLPAMRTTSPGLAASRARPNGGGAIGLDDVWSAGGFEGGFDFGEDGERIFGARDCRWWRRRSRCPRRRPGPSWGAWCGRDRRRSRRA